MSAAATVVMTIRYSGYEYRPTRKFPSANGIPCVTAPKITGQENVCGLNSGDRLNPCPRPCAIAHNPTDSNNVARLSENRCCLAGLRHFLYG